MLVKIKSFPTNRRLINIRNIIPRERISKISCLRTLSCHGLISLENYTKGIGKVLPPFRATAYVIRISK